MSDAAQLHVIAWSGSKREYVVTHAGDLIKMYVNRSGGDDRIVIEGFGATANHYFSANAFVDRATGSVTWANARHGKRPSKPGDVMESHGSVVDHMLEIYQRSPPPLEGGQKYTITDFPRIDPAVRANPTRGGGAGSDTRYLRVMDFGEKRIYEVSRTGNYAPSHPDRVARAVVTIGLDGGGYVEVITPAVTVAGRVSPAGDVTWTDAWGNAGRLKSVKRAADRLGAVVDWFLQRHAERIPELEDASVYVVGDFPVVTPWRRR